jgi:UDP-N-acetylmuramoyl-L-alanyl-D-glutamate--2,6-diaminopimelate ligase
LFKILELELDTHPNPLLSSLFEQINYRPVAPEIVPAVPINGLVLDSRKVEPGNLFFALAGINNDGHRYIPAAIERGAAAVIGTKPPDQVDTNIPYVQVSELRLTMANLAAAFYGFPARSLSVIGVTGTDGKTTTSNLIYEILRSAGIRAGIISTVNAVIGSEVIDTGFHVTTPEAPEIQSYLAQMRDSGLTHVVLESTSHGLAQDRVAACEFDIGVVTNITHEHLDYHGSYEEYLAAKARLFAHLLETSPKPQGNPRLAVLNRDDESFQYLDEVVSGPRVTYGIRAGNGYWAEDVLYDPGGVHFKAMIPDGRQVEIDSKLVGEYNISNILAALAACVSGLKIDLEDARRGIEALKGIQGRMEWIDMGQDFTAIVDFAHTPNALERTLETARRMTPGRVIAVFGSAGLRDREKRRMMAEESVEQADVTILTAEDPRTESLDSILAEMAIAARSLGAVEGTDFFRVPDRGEAIRKAVQMAHPGDLVLALGKGHEQSMCFGETEYLWDDRVAMRAALAEYLGIQGYAMPYLPTQEK